MSPLNGKGGRILLVEDDPATATLERRSLVRAGRRVQTAARVSEALEAMRNEDFEAILLDYRLPDGEPWPVLEAAKRSLPPIPVILVTAMGDERVAAEVLHRGGADYLIKSEGFWDQLAGVVDRVLKVARVERANARLAALVESSDDAIINVTLSEEILSWNAGAERLFGYSAEAAMGRPASMLQPHDGTAELGQLLERARRGEATRQLETILVRQDGTRADISLTISPINDVAGIVVSAAVSAHDITERKRESSRTALRNDVTRLIAESASLADAALPLLRLLGEWLGWDMGVLWLVEPDATTLRCAEVWFRAGRGLEELGNAARLAVRTMGGFPARLWGGQSVVSSPEIPQKWIFAPVSTLAASGLVGGVAFPVVARGLVRGAIEFLAPETPVLDQRHSEMLASIGLQLGQFVEKQMAADALRDSESWLRLALDSAGMGVWDLDLLSDTATRSLRHDQIFGYDSLQPCWGSEILYQHVLSEDRAAAKACLDGAFETGVLHLECRIRWPDGSVHWIAVDGQVLRDPHRRPVRMIGIITDVTERKAAEEALRKSTELDRVLFIGSPLPMWLYDIDSLRILAVNDAAVQQYGYSREELLSMTLRDVRDPADLPALVASHRDEAPGYHRSGVFRHRKRDGTFIRVAVHIHDVWIAERRLRLALLQDVSEREKLEEQLRQAQKMEAIGQLAGGIAHDFNNLVTVISGHTDFLLDHLKPGDDSYDELVEVSKAGERAAALTRQLLAFSRKRDVDPKVVDLNSIVTDTDKMLRRLIGEDIDLVIALDPALGRVKMDPSHAGQILMNLAVNARDAMRGGGHLVIETANVELAEDFLRGHANVQPGRYVLLAVTDNGCGMDAATQSRIFEPFFTTKEPGRGTGLGLSTVFGVVKQSGGQIYVYSEPGQGTAFKIYLPRVDAAVTPNSSGPENGTQEPTGETVLLVEDDNQVRRLASLILKRAGYFVLEAALPDEALNIVNERGIRVDLLITDVVMPQIGGPVLAKKIAEIRPGLKTLFVSGYTNRTVAESMPLDPQAPFLEKPFTARALLAKVRDVLNTGA